MSSDVLAEFRHVFRQRRERRKSEKRRKEKIEDERAARIEAIQSVSKPSVICLGIIQ